MVCVMGINGLRDGKRRVVGKEKNGKGGEKKCWLQKKILVVMAKKD